MNETGTAMIRPSNSGKATFIAVSMGPRPRELSSHSERLPVLTIPWMMGTSSLSSSSWDQPVATVAPVPPCWWSRSLMAKPMVLTMQSTLGMPSALTM